LPVYNNSFFLKQISFLHEKNQTISITEIKDVSYFKDAECYRIKLNTPLQPYTYYNLTFGQFRSDMDYDSDGLYISRYLENGIYKYLASTDLEPSDARSILPCWDEPEFKAKFKVFDFYLKCFHFRFFLHDLCPVANPGQFVKMQKY
uniref:Peptidase_M1_N domain-containing protein n=1 Tax=Schistosoma curassoni TaxID=6186 RepID=A0A183JQP2_9TREM